MVKERGANEATERWLKKNFGRIFQNELNVWHTLEEGWPKNRTYKQFRIWFDVEIISMILDLEETGISKD